MSALTLSTDVNCPVTRQRCQLPRPTIVPPITGARSCSQCVPRKANWSWLSSVFALLAAVEPGVVFAATLNVSPSTPVGISPDGRCSLSEAIHNANSDTQAHPDCAAGSGNDTIVLPVASQQPLGSLMLPTITSAIVIDGRGGTIGPRESGVILNVASEGNLILRGTTVRGSSSENFHTGGIENRGRLTLDRSSIIDAYMAPGLLNDGGIATLQNSRIANNFGLDFGGGGAGGVVNRRGIVTLDGTVVENNSSAYSAGGIWNAGTLNIKGSRIVNNHGDSPGGIFNSGVVVINGTTVAGNRAVGEYGGRGGAISNDSGGSMTIGYSTIAGNIAESADPSFSALGAGIFNAGTLTVTNSTLSGNAARSAGSGSEFVSEGGGVFSVAQATLVNVTVAQNEADEGGGIVVSAGHLTLTRSLVTGNMAVRVAPQIKNEATVTANNFNLIGQGSNAGSIGFSPGSRDIVPEEAVDQILLPLAGNGGKAFTHALAIGSSALDASPSAEGCLNKDQRGNLRPQGTSCDIGAFEGSAVLCNGFVSTQVGTEGSDTITGTAGSDVIAGLGGNDEIRGLDGNDLVCGGKDIDSIYGGTGNDVIAGGPSNDRLFGERGNDSLDGGYGIDACDGGSNAALGDQAVKCETINNVP